MLHRTGGARETPSANLRTYSNSTNQHARSLTDQRGSARGCRPRGHEPVGGSSWVIGISEVKIVSESSRHSIWLVAISEDRSSVLSGDLFIVGEIVQKFSRILEEPSVGRLFGTRSEDTVGIYCILLLCICLCRYR